MDEADDDVKSASGGIEYGTAWQNGIPFGSELQINKHSDQSRGYLFTRAAPDTISS